jgi:hypothetical protein
MVARTHLRAGPLAPASHIANLEIARRIVRRIAGIRSLQPAAAETFAVAEIALALDAASDRH